MKKFTSVHDVDNLSDLVAEAIALKENPFAYEHLGKRKTLGLVFMNPSLRTRMSTQRAARNLGMDVMVLNADQEGWKLEFNEGAIMDGQTVEHIKDAATIMGNYCDIIGLRAFPSLTDRAADYEERIFSRFMQYCQAPLVSLESATRHPLQSFADLLTITETKQVARPKVVLTWAPHIKALPQAVPNSFAEWMLRADVEFVIAHPQGYALDETFTAGASVCYNQEEALQGADFVYAKNWSSYEPYGKLLPVAENWLLSTEKMRGANEGAKIMHCLPVRRNVELPDALLDGENSLIYAQAQNRIYAAQAVLKKMLETR